MTGLRFIPIALSIAVLPAVAAPPALSPADQTAVFKAAGFKLTGKQWRSDCGDPGTASYSPGAVESVADLNGDGLPEAVLTEGGAYCYGNTGGGYWLMSKQKAGGWKVMSSGTGMIDALKTKGVGGWPDISIGGPGFCFPVHRWNGKAYALHRREYSGKPCR